MHSSMRFWRVRFRALRDPAASASRRGQGLLPLSRNTVRLPSEQAFSFAGIPNNQIRIISARMATPRECRQYEEGITEDRG